MDKLWVRILSIIWQDEVAVWFISDIRELTGNCGSGDQFYGFSHQDLGRLKKGSMWCAQWTSPSVTAVPLSNTLCTLQAGRGILIPWKQAGWLSQRKIKHPHHSFTAARKLNQRIKRAWFIRTGNFTGASMKRSEFFCRVINDIAWE